MAKPVGDSQLWQVNEAPQMKTFLDSIANARAASVAVFLALTTIAVSGAEEASITLSGSYEYSVYAGRPAPRYSATYAFHASVGGRAWIIRYEDTSALTNADTLNAEAIASCDGTNTYLVQFQNELAVRKVFGERYESVKHELPVAMATIYPGDYPPPKEPTLQNIWLAIASSSVLSAARGKAKPPFITDLETFYDTNYNCDYYWTTDQAQPERRELVLKTDRHLLEDVWINGKKQRVKPAPPYDHGHTNGVGLWKQATNIAGVVVATEFEFTAFAPGPTRRSAGDLARAYIYRCIVTNIAKAPIPSVPVPLPAGRVTVTDRRFDKSEDGGNHYLAKKDWSQTEMDPAELAAHQSVKLDVGSLAPDFIVKTFEGKLFRLSDLRGKYVLLDFWATSCAPCVREIPDFQATYDAFGKDERFVLISLSMDTSEKEPRGFIAARGIRWTQSFMDDALKSSVEQDYGFSAIPQVLLVGPDGKLVAKDLRGETIRQAVASALGSR